MAIVGETETWRGGALKVALAAGLVVYAEVAVLAHPVGGALGGFCLLWLVATAVVTPRMLRSRAAAIAALCALLLGLIAWEAGGPLALMLLWVAISAAALLTLERFDDVFRWLQRGFLHGVVSLFGPLIDAYQLRRAVPPGQSRRWLALAPMLILPLVGGAVFLILFATANPILAQALERLQLPPLDQEFFVRVIFAGLVLVVVWGAFRPRLLPPFVTGKATPLDVPPMTLILSLVVFNAIFALQNGLDVAFLWSGADLPAGVNFAEYAHRGAYTLILTAILAAGFVLVALHPETSGGRSVWVRRLVTIWTLQNVLLVASSALRLSDYIEAYGLTRLRIAALVWMALVAVGLALICWRLLASRSTPWLINANALALAVVLGVSSVVDYGAVAAAWNVHHPRTLAAGNRYVDVCYLEQLGARSLVSLVELEHSAEVDPVVREAAASVRQPMVQELTRIQADRYAWTWRNQRRLERAKALNGGQPFAMPAVRRLCSGLVMPIYRAPPSPPQE